MWIISVDVPYYPYILKFKTEEEARKEYKFRIEQKDKDEGVFLAEVKDCSFGSDYEIEYGNY